MVGWGWKGVVLTLSHFSANRKGAMRSIILQKLFTSDMFFGVLSRLCYR